MRERYTDQKFKPDTLAIIEKADEILAEYAADNLVVTVRQLYYQFVARDLIPNSQKSYKRLADIIMQGRMAGLLDWDRIEDRGRLPESPSEWSSIDQIVDAAVAQFKLPRLRGQHTYAELWVEKQALAGVLAPLAREFHVTLMVNKGYCVDPQVKVLTADLRWVPAGSITPGARLIGVDEDVPGPKQHRRMRAATVEACHRFVSSRVRVTTDRGAIVVSANHPFLAVKYANPKIHGYSWVEAAHLRPGCRIAFLAAPWSEESSFEAGWLSGIYDGEGCLPRTMPGRTLSVYQKPGAVADRIRTLLQARGWLTREDFKESGGVLAFHTTGVERILTALGTLRPVRLLNDFARHAEEGWYPAKGKYPATVVSVEPLPPGEVIGLETSTRTLITDGYVSHNSSASAMRESALRFEEKAKELQQYRGKWVDRVLFYLGDHDPSGEDMVRDIRDRLTTFGVKRLDVRKVALTMGQIEQYDPPPNPAKTTDSRYEKYAAKHGTESWELDALDPPTLRAVIRAAFASVVDRAAWDAVIAEETEQRTRMKAAVAAMRSESTAAPAPDAVGYNALRRMLDDARATYGLAPFQAFYAGARRFVLVYLRAEGGEGVWPFGKDDVRVLVATHKDEAITYTRDEARERVALSEPLPIPRGKIVDADDACDAAESLWGIPVSIKRRVASGLALIFRREDNDDWPFGEDDVRVYLAVCTDDGSVALYRDRGREKAE